MRESALQAFGEKANKKLAADKAKLSESPLKSTESPGVTGQHNHLPISKMKHPHLLAPV